MCEQCGQTQNSRKSPHWVAPLLQEVNSALPCHSVDAGSAGIANGIANGIVLLRAVAVLRLVEIEIVRSSAPWPPLCAR